MQLLLNLIWGTARSRVSLKRHARLFDYRVDEGCNSRVFVHFKVNKDLVIPRRTVLFTNPPGNVKKLPAYSSDEFEKIKNDVEIFETIYPTTIYKSHNEFLFYTFGDPKCVLPKGSTKAYLKADKANFLFSHKFNLDKISDDALNDDDTDNDTSTDLGQQEGRQNLLKFLQTFDVSWLDNVEITIENVRVLPDDDTEEAETGINNC